MKKRFDIILEKRKVGTTQLEHADVTMGVLFGKIYFEGISDGYSFFKDYCLDNLIGVTKYPEERLISTRHIPNLRVLDNDGTEINGLATSISGQADDDFQITIEGVSHSLFVTKFKHHIASIHNLVTENVCADNIDEIGIDDLERFYVVPETQRFILIYRTATGVHWDETGGFLYSPKPAEWTHLDWYKQIVGVVESECNCKLLLTSKTKWKNISDDLKRQIWNA